MNFSILRDLTGPFHFNFDLREQKILDLVQNANYLDNHNYKSTYITRGEGYKAYFFNDCTVGYFYNWGNDKNRWSGWIHPTKIDFEYFYNNVY